MKAGEIYDMDVSKFIIPIPPPDPREKELALQAKQEEIKQLSLSNNLTEANTNQILSLTNKII